MWLKTSKTYIFVNKIIIFVNLVPDLKCKQISSAGLCKKTLKYSWTRWSQVCALTCGDKELCPTPEYNPSFTPGEFHNLSNYNESPILSCGVCH